MYPTFTAYKRFYNYGENAGAVDVQNMLSSNILICSGDEVELNPGTAALIGLARSLGKLVILYESSDLEIHGENGHRMKKNLMIDFSVNKIAKNKEQIVDLVMEVFDV